MYTVSSRRTFNSAVSFNRKCLKFGSTSEIQLSKGDIDKLTTPIQNRGDIFYPTGALIGLYNICTDHDPVLANTHSLFDSFYVISGISRIESPSRERLAVLESALDVLTQLDEPLARKSWDQYALTQKGINVAQAIIEKARQQDSSWGLGYGDTSAKILQELTSG